MPHRAKHDWVGLGLATVEVGMFRWLVRTVCRDRKRCFGMLVWRCCGVRFYPCQLFTPFSVWTAQKRTRLVAVDSASAPTRIARCIEAWGIAAPPRYVLSRAFVIVVEMCTVTARGSRLIGKLSGESAASRSACDRHLLSGDNYLLTWLLVFCVDLGCYLCGLGFLSFSPVQAPQSQPLALFFVCFVFVGLGFKCPGG